MSYYVGLGDTFCYITNYMILLSVSSVFKCISISEG